MAGYTYKACHPITRQLLAPPLRFDNPSWTEKANGVGEFNGKVAIPSNPDIRDQLRSALEPDESAIYVIAPNGSIPFAGVVTEAPYDPTTQTVDVRAVGWRSWFYNWFLPPKLDLTGDLLYDWTNQDQLFIARSIAACAIAGGAADGRPTIDIGAELSGKNRDLHIKGLDFKYAGELLDTMARRAGGFEWDVVAYIAADGLPRLKFVLGYPEIGAFQSGVVLRNTANGANFAVNGSVPRSSSSRRTRVWTTGANSTDTLPFAVDSDPTISTTQTLTSERVSAYSTVVDRATLSDHARAERIFLNDKVAVLDIIVQSTVIDPATYGVGDRFRLIYHNGWNEIELPAVRVIEREVSPIENAGQTRLKLDLSDAVMPDVDEGVTAP